MNNFIFYKLTRISFTLITLLSLISCQKEKDLDLTQLSTNKTAIFKMINRSGESFGPAYCHKFSQIVDLRLEKIKGHERLIVACLALNQEHIHTLERNRFFKYAWITKSGEVTFCGWRDHNYHLKKDMTKYWDNLKYGETGDCDGFYIHSYQHQ